MVPDPDGPHALEARDDVGFVGVRGGEHPAGGALRHRLEVQHRARVDLVHLVDAVHQGIAADLDVEVHPRVGLLQPLDRVVVADHRELHGVLQPGAHRLNRAAGLLDQRRGSIHRRLVHDDAQARLARRQRLVRRQRVGEGRNVGGDQPRSRFERGDLPDDREGVVEVVEAGVQRRPLLLRFERELDPRDDPGDAVVVEVGVRRLRVQVDEAGIRLGVHHVERAHVAAHDGGQHPVLDRAGAARTPREEPAHRRLHGGGEHQHLLAGLVGGLLDLDHRSPGVGDQVAVTHLDDPARLRHVEHETACHRDRLAVIARSSPARGDRDAMANGGADGHRDALGIRRICDQLGAPERQLLHDHR